MILFIFSYLFKKYYALETYLQYWDLDFQNGWSYAEALYRRRRNYSEVLYCCKKKLFEITVSLNKSELNELIQWVSGLSDWVESV